MSYIFRLDRAQQNPEEGEKESFMYVLCILIFHSHFYFCLIAALLKLTYYLFCA